MADIKIEEPHMIFAALMIPPFYVTTMLTNDIMDRIYDRDLYRWFEVIVCDVWRGDNDFVRREQGASEESFTPHQRMHTGKGGHIT